MSTKLKPWSHEPVPVSVKKWAALGLLLHQKGYKGGTETGWKRAKQLAKNDSVSYKTINKMRVWFARHGPPPENGGVSYQKGRCIHNILRNPTSKSKNRAFVAWAIWGGDAAFRWIRSKKVTTNLDRLPKMKGLKKGQLCKCSKCSDFRSRGIRALTNKINKIKQTS